MKKLTMLCLAACICTSAALAQDTSKAMHKMHHDGGMKMKDCVMMEDGKLTVMKGGKSSAMDKEVSLTNGGTVTTDGTVKMKDGTSTQLKDGDCVYMDGKIVSGKKGMMKKKSTP